MNQTNDRKNTERVLIVDDEQIIRELLSRALSAAGFIVGTADNGEDAWQLLQQQKFDVMVLDWKMPVLDGLGLLRRVRASHQAIAAILMTGQPDIDTAQEAVRLGCFDYLLKPFNVKEVVQTVERVCLVRQLQQTGRAPDMERLIPLTKTGVYVCRRATAALASARQMLSRLPPDSAAPQSIQDLLAEIELSERSLQGFMSCAEQAGDALSAPYAAGYAPVEASDGTPERLP